MFVFRIVFFIFLLSIISLGQTAPNKYQASNNSLKKDTGNKIKNDILKEIKSLSIKDQAIFYNRIGNIYQEIDEKEAQVWFNKSIELKKKNPKIFKKDDDKLSTLANSLSDIIDENKLEANKIIAQIKSLEVDETKPEKLEEANKTYLKIAKQLLSNDFEVKVAFEFAMLSLKGKNPIVNEDSSICFLLFKKRNSEFAYLYFTNLLESAAKNDKLNFAIRFLFNSQINRYSQTIRQQLSDAELKFLLNLITPDIQKESEKLSQKQIGNCEILQTRGIGFLEEFKRVSPENLPVIEKAISICQNSEIESWKKPDFMKRPRKTAQDFVNLAKEITDHKTKINQLTFAAQKAREERNYLFSLEILDGIEEKDRDDFWVYSKIESSSKLIEEFFKTDDFPAISNISGETTAELRPFIIVKSLGYIRRSNDRRKEFVLNLIKQARFEFNKIEKFSASMVINPTYFNEITTFYVRFGFLEEAILTHEETVKSFNRVAKNLPPNYKAKNYIPRITSFSRFTNSSPPDDVEFVNKYFDRIYQNIEKIEDQNTRIYERLWMLALSFRQIKDQPLIPRSVPALIPGIPNLRNKFNF